MIAKVSFYGYFFKKSEDQIIRYDILWKAENKYLLKYTQLDRNFRNPTDDVTVTIHSSLFDCVASIVCQLRNLEVEHRIYQQLKPVSTPDDHYGQLINDLCDSITNKGIRSFSFFGNIGKYRPQNVAKEYLRMLGIFVLATKPPHVYVLNDFISKEQVHLSDK